MMRTLRALTLLLGLLWASQAHAGVYPLITNATATQTVVANTSTNTIANAQSILGGPLQNQVFVVAASGPNAPSCTVQIYGSNDAVTWVTYGSTIAASSFAGGSPNAGAAGTGTTPFVYYAALVTAISGTGTKCSVTMSG